MCPNIKSKQGDFFFLHENSISYRDRENIGCDIYSRCNSTKALSTLGKIFRRRQIRTFFFYFPQKTGLDMSSKLSPLMI